MKKFFVFALMGMIMVSSMAYAAEPSWLSSDAIDALSNVPGFTFDYDEMDDRLGVYVSGKAAEYQSGDAYLNPLLEAYGSDAMFFEIVCTGEDKYDQAMTGAIFLIDGTRYIFEVSADLQNKGFTYLPVGKTAAEMIHAITASTNPIKVRYEYPSGKVDFEMTAFQIKQLGNLFAAFEAAGGTSIPIFDMIDLAQPVTIR